MKVYNDSLSRQNIYDDGGSQMCLFPAFCKHIQDMSAAHTT